MDSWDKLTREDNPYLGQSYTYLYDNAGNRTSKKIYAYTTDTLGTATSTQTYTYNSDSTWGDQLNGYTYDEIGNPSYYNGYALTWSGRQLMEMNRNAGQSVLTFAYNSDGIRTSKKSGSVEHIYTLDGSRIVSEAVGNVLMVYLYDESGSPIGLQYRTNSYAAGVFDTYYFEKNWQGDILAVYTEAGVLIGSYTYDAWGNCTVNEVSTAMSLQRSIVRTRNPFRYRGYYYDTETQLYYLQSRYYNPATGRFINEDAYISTGTGLLGYNMYAYCSNNPVMHVDHDGLVEDDLQELDDTGGLIDLDGLGGRAQQPTRYQAQREGRATGQRYQITNISQGTSLHPNKTSVPSVSQTKATYSQYVASSPTGMMDISTAGQSTQIHHVVERCQENKSNFSHSAIESTDNKVIIDKTTHQEISGHYSSIQEDSGGMRVRDWLAGKSFAEQYAYGWKIIAKKMGWD